MKPVGWISIGPARRWWFFIWFSGGSWQSSSGSVLVRQRLYLQGKPIPIVAIRLRYPVRSFWNGVWPVRRKRRLSSLRIR